MLGWHDNSTDHLHQVTEALLAKVADFGLSRLSNTQLQGAEETMKYYIGKSDYGPLKFEFHFDFFFLSSEDLQRWLAPEAVESRVYSTKSDGNSSLIYHPNNDNQCSLELWHHRVGNSQQKSSLSPHYNRFSLRHPSSAQTNITFLFRTIWKELLQGSECGEPPDSPRHSFGTGQSAEEMFGHEGR